MWLRLIARLNVLQQITSKYSCNNQNSFLPFWTRRNWRGSSVRWRRRPRFDPRSSVCWRTSRGCRPLKYFRKLESLKKCCRSRFCIPLYLSVSTWYDCKNRTIIKNCFLGPSLVTLTVNLFSKYRFVIATVPRCNMFICDTSWNKNENAKTLR